MMHGEVGFQAVRLSLRDDVTMMILTVRYDGSVGKGQAMDTWMLTQQLDDADLPWFVGHPIAMIRRAVEP